MADQKRWFKVWGTIALDPSFLELPLEVVGRWTLLGAWIATHGEKGRIVAGVKAVRHVLRIPESAPIIPAIQALPHVRFDVVDDNNDVVFDVPVDVPLDDNAKLAVIMLNWTKYQLDSTGYDRLKKHRQRVDDNGLREEKTKRRTPIVPKGTGDVDGFADFWALYPRRVAKQAAVKAWVKLHPAGDLRVKILEALAAQVTGEYAHREPEKIPHAATWLNGRRWEDEASIPGNGNGSHAADRLPNL